MSFCSSLVNLNMEYEIFDFLHVWSSVGFRGRENEYYRILLFLVVTGQ